MASEEDPYSTITLKGTPVSELRVTDIKRELDKRGLSKSGSKTQLLDRLKAQLLLEKLQQGAAQSSGDELEGKVPNRALQQDDKAGQSEFVRQYLQQQQRNLEIQMEMKKQVEGANSYEEGQKRKDRSESPVAERERLRESPQSRSSSSRSPSPDKSSQNQRGRSSRGRAKRGGGRRGGQQGRSSSPSSSPEEVMPKKKQKRTNSSSHSGSRSPQMISPEMPTRRSNRRSSTTVKATPDHVLEKEMSCDGSGDKSFEKNENANSERKWRKEQSAEVTKESPENARNKEDSAKSASTTASAVHTADRTKDRKESGEFTKVHKKPGAGNGAFKSAKEPVVAETSVTESSASEVAASDPAEGTLPAENQVSHSQSQSKLISAKANTSKEQISGDPGPNVKNIDSTVLLTKESSAKKVESDKKVVSDNSETVDQNVGKTKGEKSQPDLQKEMVSRGNGNSPPRSRRQRSRSSGSSSERSRSQPKSPARKKQSRSRSSSSSSSDSQSRSQSSSSGSSTDRSPAKEIKKNSQVQSHSKDKSVKHPHSPERIVQADRVDTTRKDASVQKKIDHSRKEDKAPIQTITSSEPKYKNQEEKLTQHDKEQEGKSYETKGQQEMVHGDQNASSGKITELMDQSKVGSNADTDEVAKKGIKKRKWGSKTSKAAKTKRTSSMEISSDVLKNLIGDVKLTETVFEMETEVVNTLDYDEHEEDRRDVKVKREVIQSPDVEEMATEQEDARRVESREESSPEHHELPPEPEKKIIKLSNAAPKIATKTKVKDGKKSKDEKKKKDSAGKEPKDNAISDKDTKEKVFATTRPIKPLLPVVDEPEPVSGSQSPPRNPPNRVIRIAGLVRPFTVGQLKELLKRTGELDDEYFWINAIKSHCLAAYKTQEEAIAARAALHGTRWPQSNPKILIVDFATVEDVMHRKTEGDVPLPALNKRPQEEPKKLKEQKNDEEKEKRQKEKEQREKNREEREKEKRETRERKREPEKKNPIREWDRDKIQQLSRSRSKSKERERLARRSRSRERDQRKRADQHKEKKDEDRRKERKQKETKAEEEPPAKLLDDLFRKTKATPCIYWLPLTEEQAQQRLVKKLEQEKERQKRVAAAEEREKEELKKRETARLERQRERERARDKSRERSRQDRSRSSRSRSKRRR